ncbi:hypothetical protein SGLAU_22160 [Streptomyces glaucescens]|uniref:Uncharacterized protein n=1 Tax=Streptomyces glaucescens TaxID=1907 RepID=A0A089XB06_STRGA|nr:hypothetical protein SGLAU_22160 [Streptomyces glaucescens]
MSVPAGGAHAAPGTYGVQAVLGTYGADPAPGTYGAHVMPGVYGGRRAGVRTQTPALTHEGTHVGAPTRARARTTRRPAGCSHPAGRRFRTRFAA